MGIIKQNVTLLGAGNKEIKVNALIDSGAETSFITKRLADRMGYIPIRKVKSYLGDGSKVDNTYFTIGAIRIKGRDFSIKLIMVDNLGGDELVIGVDFMQEHRYILVLKDDKLYIKPPKYNYKGYRL